MFGVQIKTMHELLENIMSDIKVTLLLNIHYFHRYLVLKIYYYDDCLKIYNGK